MSATEYVEGLNDLVAIATADLTASSAAYAEIEEPTMPDWAAFVDREIAARRAFVDGFAVQCGFCTPGFVMTLTALIEENPSPTAGEVRDALSGNLCRCTGYTTIVDAVLAATGVRT